MNCEIFQSFSCDKTAFDDFIFKFICMEKFKYLSFVVKKKLPLSHGQAAVEQSFSLGNALLNYDISEDSVKAKKVIEDHMGRQKYQTF